jgi:signal peptidase I
MSEPKTKKRKVLIAILLSFIMPGLGHIYCGRIAKGITVILFIDALIPAILISIFEIHFSGFWLIISMFIGLLLSLFIMVDSGRIAKYKSENYVLKDYNKWYVYLMLYMAIEIFSNQTSQRFWANIMDAFITPSISNYPTLVPGDRVLGNKVAYKTDDPKRGDMVIFINPSNRSENFIKRVIAVAGDTIEMKDNQVYVNGQQLQQQKLPQSILDNIRINYPNGRKVEGDVLYEFNGSAKYKIFLSKLSDSRIIRDFAPLIVPKHHCFVLGDNRDASIDSRNFGPIPLATIKGRVNWLCRPSKDWSRFGRLDAE